MPLVSPPLGATVPASPHATVVSLPTLADVEGYERKDPATLRHITVGYPRFVRNRLRYVDTVQKSIAPWAAGGAAFLIGAVLAPFLPLVGLGTALTAGLAVGSGVAAGARDIKQGTSPVVYGP